MEVRPPDEILPAPLADEGPALTWALLWRPPSLAPLLIGLKRLTSNRQFIKPLIPFESSWTRPEVWAASSPLHESCSCSCSTHFTFPFFPSGLSSLEILGAERPAATHFALHFLAWSLSSLRCIGWFVAKTLTEFDSAPIFVSSQALWASGFSSISPQWKKSLTKCFCVVPETQSPILLLLCGTII